MITCKENKSRGKLTINRFAKSQKTDLMCKPSNTPSRSRTILFHLNFVPNSDRQLSNFSTINQALPKVRAAPCFREETHVNVFHLPAWPLDATLTVRIIKWNFTICWHDAISLPQTTTANITPLTCGNTIYYS